MWPRTTRGLDCRRRTRSGPSQACRRAQRRRLPSPCAVGALVRHRGGAPRFRPAYRDRRLLRSRRLAITAQNRRLGWKLPASHRSTAPAPAIVVRHREANPAMDRLAGVARARCLRLELGGVTPSARDGDRRPVGLHRPRCRRRPCPGGGRGRAGDQGAALLEHRGAGEAPGALSRREPGRAGVRLDAARRAAPARARGRARADRLHRRCADLGDDAHRRRRPPRPAAVPGLRARGRAALLGPGKRVPRVRYWQAWNEPNKVAEPGGQGGGGGLVSGTGERVRRKRAHACRETSSSPAASRRSGSRPPSRRSRSCATCCASPTTLDPARPARRASTSTSGRRTRTPRAGRRTASPAPTTSRSLSCPR